MSVSFDELHEEIADLEEQVNWSDTEISELNEDKIELQATVQELRCRVEVLDYKVSQRSTEIIETRFENEYLKRLLKEAAILAEIASDWNLYEVEIQHEMVSTLHLASKFRNASNSTNQEGHLTCKHQ